MESIRFRKEGVIVAKKESDRSRTSYYSSEYSKDYNRRTGQRSARSRNRRSRLKEILIILLALLVLAAAVFGVIKLVQSRRGDHGTGLKTAPTASVTSTTANVGTARVLSEKDAEMIRNSEKYKNIMAHKEDYPEYLIDDLEMNPEITDFVAGYLDAEPVGHGGLTAAEKKSSHPLFVQWDKRWGYSTYGESCMAISGCGPTALAMVAYGLTRNASIDPYEVAQFAMKNGYYVNNVGTSWALMNEGARHYGIVPTSQYSFTEEQLKDALNKGGMVLLSVGHGDFTVHNGHFIVLYGCKDGKFKVNDPFSYTNSSKLWDYETLRKQTKNMWIYYKADSEAAATMSTTTTTVAATTAATTVVTSTTLAPSTGIPSYATTTALSTSSTVG